MNEAVRLSAQEEQVNDTTFTAIESDTQEDVVEEEVTDDITDVLPSDIPIEELTKAHLIKLLHYRTDRSQQEIEELVDVQQSYVSSVVSDLSEDQHPELVGTLHECRENNLVRYVKCVECEAVFDLETVGWTRRPKWKNIGDPVTHVDWFQHNRFEGYVVKPRGKTPPSRPANAVKNHEVVES